MIDRAQLYMVSNESKSPVCVTTRTGGLEIPGASEDGTPALMPMNIDDITFINSTSNAFKIGLLFFAEDEYREEIYEYIKLYDWRGIMHNEDIADIILNPTIEKLQKVLDIKNQQYFERIRGIYTSLSNRGYDVSKKVADVITGRYKEFMTGKYTSRIELVPKEKEQAAVTSEIDELKAQIAELTKLITAKTQTEAKEEEPKAETAAETKPKTAKKTTVKKTTAKTE